MRASLLPTRRVSMIGAAIAVLVTGGTALAFWISSGAGSGSAQIDAAPQQVTIVATNVTPASALTPGATADLVVQLSNPNPYSVTLTGISQNGDVLITGAPGCTASNSGVTVASQTGLSISLATGTDVLHLPAAASMSATSDSSCQGASFQIPLAITAQL